MCNVKSIAAALPLIGVVLGSAYAAAPPIVYPSKGQTAQQQQKDTSECAAWATQSTGIDPAALAATPAPAPAATQPAASTGPQGERVKGAVRGAAAGAIVGEVANNDADEGARYGAAAGVVAGGSQQRRGRREAQAQQQQASQSQQKAAADAEAAKQEKLATYNRANAACLEGRGYVIK